MTWDVRRGVRQLSRALCTRRIAHGFTSSRKPSTPRLTSLSRPLHRISNQPWLAEHFWALSPAARRARGDGWHRPGVSYWPDASDGIERGGAANPSTRRAGPAGARAGGSRIGWRASRESDGAPGATPGSRDRPGRGPRRPDSPARKGWTGPQCAVRRCRSRSSRLAAARPRGRCEPEAAELSMQLDADLSVAGYPGDSGKRRGLAPDGPVLARRGNPVERNQPTVQPGFDRRQHRSAQPPTPACPE
jgi:hypothetical protein